MNEIKRNRRSPRKKHQQRDMADRWLLTYADMITLLLGLFIIMYSISTVDATKLQSVASIIRGGFGLDTNGTSLVHEGNAGIIRDPDLVPKSIIYRLWERLKHAVNKPIITDRILIKLENNEELTVTVPASSLGEGKIKLPSETENLFAKLAEMNKEIPIDIIVRVQIPYLENIDKTTFQNNWEFNAHRASLIAKFISKKYNIDEANISVQGLSEFRKSSDTITPEQEADQERLEILIRKRPEPFIPPVQPPSLKQE